MPDTLTVVSVPLSRTGRYGDDIMKMFPHYLHNTASMFSDQSQRRPACVYPRPLSSRSTSWLCDLICCQVPNSFLRPNNWSANLFWTGSHKGVRKDEFECWRRWAFFGNDNSLRCKSDGRVRFLHQHLNNYLYQMCWIVLWLVHCLYFRRKNNFTIVPVMVDRWLQKRKHFMDPFLLLILQIQAICNKLTIKFVRSLKFLKSMVYWWIFRFVISSDFCHWGNRFRYTYYDQEKGAIHQSITNLDKQVVS